MVELFASLFGRCDGHAIFGQYIERLLMFGGLMFEAALLRCDLLVELRQSRLSCVDGRLQFGELRFKGTKLAPPRDQPGRRVPRSDRQRSIRFQKLAGKRHKRKALAIVLGQGHCMGEFFDEPSSA